MTHVSPRRGLLRRRRRSPIRLALPAAAALLLSLAAGSAQAATGANLLQNPSLETTSGSAPACWKLGGYGTNGYTWTQTTDAHSGTVAERLTISSLSSGDRKLLPAQDSGACAPAATPGTAYTVGAWYKQPSGTSGAPRFFAYYRTSAGAWTYWSESRRFASSGSWTYVTWSTPLVPSGATNISVGLGLDQPGSVVMDDFSLTAQPAPDTTAPSVPTGVQATPGDGQVALSWTASTDNTGVTGYRVYRNGALVTTVPGTSMTDTGLTDGTSYSYSVAAVDAAGNASAQSTPVSATPVAPISSGGSSATGATCPSPGPVTTWAPPGTKPLTDAQAAACVVHQPENRPGNVQANDYVPTDAQLQAFHSAPQEHAPLTQYVTGRPGLSSPSTDDLIQWTAHKWGIPEDWIRAEMAVESWWHQSDLGDRTTVSSTWYPQFPQQAQIPGTSDVYESMGISQVRWSPDANDFGVGTNPLRWQSTAFALDFYAAVVRWYYDGDCSWCGAGYSSGQPWNSIGGWYSPYPWGNSGAANYVAQVQSDLASRVWAQAGF